MKSMLFFFFSFSNHIRENNGYLSFKFIKIPCQPSKKATYGKNGNKYIRTKLQGLMTAYAFSLPVLLSKGKRRDDYSQGLKPLSLQILPFWREGGQPLPPCFHFVGLSWPFLPREGQLPEIWERETVNCRNLHPSVLALTWGNALQV